MRVAVLSGRRLEHIYRLLPLSGVFLAGTYGIEWMTPTGEIIQRAELPAIRPTLERIKQQWAQLLNGRQGFFLEDKGWALALHARFADEREAEQVIARARQLIDAAALVNRLRVLGGHKFLEIAPQLASKREAVEYLIKHYPMPGARLLYVGDDDKDEEAFPVIHAHQGVAIKVRQPSQAGRPTEADFFFESPGETLHWLKELV